MLQHHSYLRNKLFLCLLLLALMAWKSPVAFAADSNLRVVKQVSSTTPAAGETFTYTIRYRCTGITEPYCTSPTITDTLPAPLKIVSYTAMGGQVTSAAKAGNTLTWTLASRAGNLPASAPTGSLATGSTGMLKVHVRFPSCGVTTPPDDVTNQVTANTGGNISDSTAPAVTLPTATGEACPVLPPPADPGFTKYGSAHFIQPGGIERWKITLPDSDIPYTVTETVPAGMQAYIAESTKATSVMTHPAVDCSDDGIDNFYAIAQPLDDWAEDERLAGRAANMHDANGDPTGCVASLLPSGITVSNIKRLRWEVAANIGKQTINLRFVVNDDYVGDGIYNCAQSTEHGTDCADFLPIVGTGSPILRLTKAVPTGGAVSADGSIIVYAASGGWKPIIAPAPLSNDRIYRVSMALDELSGTATQHPILEDILPAELDYIDGAGGNWWRISVPTNKYTTDQPACNYPQFTRTALNDGRIKLRWEFVGCHLPVGLSDPALAVYMSTRIRPGIPAGTRITNVAAFSTGDYPGVMCINGADAGETDVAACHSSNVNYTVPELTSLESLKRVQGDLDNTYTRTPNTGHAQLSGTGTYLLDILNSGNVTDTSIDVVDILPWIGDSALLSSATRASEWSAELSGAISLERIAIDGSSTPVPASELPFGLQYSDDTNPCIMDSSGQITANTGAAIAPAGCTQTRDNTAENARAFGFRWTPGTGLLPGETLRVSVPIRQLTGEISVANTVAWNSFAYTASYLDTTSNDTQMLLSSEPPKVGLTLVDSAGSAGLGDYVWFDSNGDGQQGVNEPPLEGVIVSLYDGDTLIAETLTNVSGHYTFPGLLPDHTYTISLDKADNTLPGAVLSGLTPSTISVEPNATTGAMGTFTSTYDFGFTRLAALGNYVWFDDNGDGAQDENEAGIPMVTVSLKDAAGNTIQTTQTDAAGLYVFEDLPPGDYSLAFSDLPADYVFTRPDATGNPQTDSDVDSSGATVRITLAAGARDMSWDAGIKPLEAPPPEIATLGGKVWYDLDRNGLQTGEAPDNVSGVRVVLLDADGFPLDSILTDAQGQYQFTNLAPGTYAVKFDLATLPANYTATLQGASGSKDSGDSDANIFSGETEMITLVADESDLSWDLGILEPLVDLNLTKTIDKASALRGDTVVYTLTVNNAGDSTANGVRVIDLLPDDLLFLSASPAGVYYPDSGVWQVGSVPPDTDVVLEISVRVR